MTSPRYARLVAEVLKRSQPRVSEVPPSGSNRDEEIELIERTMARRRRRARHWRVIATSAAAVFLLASGASLWRHESKKGAAAIVAAKALEKTEMASAAPVVVAISSGNGAIVAAPGSTAAAVAGRALQAGSRLIVDPSAGATLSLSTGTHLEVEPGSQLGVVEDGRTQVFALNAGSLRADVAKLGRDERFIVRTADAEVEVRGTSFLVDVVPPDPECGAGTTTRVTVYEGIVAVRSRGEETSVRPGERWPAGCRKVSATPPPIPANRSVKVEALPSARPTAPPSGSDSGRRDVAQDLGPPSSAQVGAQTTQGPANRRAAASNLTEENNLFAEGMLARRDGNLRVALAKMDRFLERYPASHLAENAVAERMRLLRALDPARAATAARQYLQLYPSGFARADAEAILTGTR